MEIRGGRTHAEQWINGVFDDQNKTQVSQCLNDIDNMTTWTGSGVTGKVTDIYVKDIPDSGQTYRVYHVSAGIPGTTKTCTLFFIQDTTFDAANVIGVYQHCSSKTYEKVWKSAYYNLENTITL